MITGPVVDHVWATKRIDGIPPGAWLTIRAGDREVIALDVLGAGRGDVVVVATGSVAARYLETNTPIDAVVIGIVDQQADVQPRRRAQTKAPTKKKGS